MKTATTERTRLPHEHRKANRAAGIRYTDEPMDLKPVADFLPAPEELALKDDTVKVTIALSKSSVAFFKQTARRRGAKYQVMIRNLLDHYAAQYH